MKLGIFAYNFEHQKTREGLLNLFLNGWKPECVFAANYIDLKHPSSRVRTTPKALEVMHPRHIAEVLGIPYYIIEHNSDECIALAKKYELDVGIVLGARLLTRRVIEAFGIGIVNMHPGLLPENRGLDTLKWAILKKIRQGVTCHLIDEKVDAGSIVVRESIQVYEDDTLLDLHLRLQNKEQELLPKALSALASGEAKLEPVLGGEPLGLVPPELETKLSSSFEEYKRSYDQLNGREQGGNIMSTEIPTAKRELHVFSYCGKRQMYYRIKEHNYKCVACGHVDFAYDEGAEEGCIVELRH